VTDEEMYQVYNMGVGFCIVVPAAEADRAQSILKDAGSESLVLGRAVTDPERAVRLPNGLVARGSTFRRE
jgi:phosphoribosylformylglycinamidine cyclo-ligase